MNQQLTAAEKADLENQFTYHKPFGDQPARYEAIRAAGKLLAEEIILKTPPSPERSISLRKVRESVQWANAAIAINEVNPEAPKSDVTEKASESAAAELTSEQPAAERGPVAAGHPEPAPQP